MLDTKPYNFIIVCIMDMLDLTTVDRTIPIGIRRAWRGDTGMIYSGILPGDYLLKDNSFSASTVWGQEKGIFFDNFDYLILDQLTPNAVTASEALGYCKVVGMELPSRKRLEALEKFKRIVNHSLRTIGKHDCQLLSNVVQNYWSKEAAEIGEPGYRRIVITGYAGFMLFNIPNIQGVRIKDTSPRIPGIYIADQHYEDASWLLQDIGLCWYYVLESRCRHYSDAPQDMRRNGRCYIKGNNLIVENPTGDVFYKGTERYARTIKDYFTMDNYGIYRKTDSIEGSVLAPETEK